MKFQFFKPDEVVFEYNDYGNLFYVIIDGTCSVQVPNTKPIVKNQTKKIKEKTITEKAEIAKKRLKKIESAWHLVKNMSDEV